MGVLESAFIKAKNAADIAGKKTGEFVEISRLKVQASESEQKINEAYRELGKLVYNASKEHTDCTELVSQKAEHIDSLILDYSGVLSKIQDLKREKTCPECHYSNPEEAFYCQKCGSKLD